MDLETAVLEVLTHKWQTTYEINRQRLDLQNDEGYHGTAATVACLQRLVNEGKVRHTVHSTGIKSWRLA